VLDGGTGSRRRIAIALGVLGAATIGLWLTRPLVISGDGVGYIKRLLTPRFDVIPGHLVYIPFLEWLRNVMTPSGGHSEAAAVATAVSAVGAGVACACLCALTTRLTRNVLSGLVAAAGLCVSYGFYRASGDVEAYSLAVAVLTGLALVSLRRDDEAKRGWITALVAGLLLAFATLLHTSLVLITPFVLFAAWRSTGSWLKAGATVAIGGAVSLACFLWMSMGVLGHDLGGFVSWLQTSDNGYAQAPALSLTFLSQNAGRLFYGVGRSLIHSPASDRLGADVAFRLSLIGITYFGLVAAVTIVGLRVVPRESRRPLWPLWVWVLPLLVFSFFFFPAATERWVMILPCFWLAVAVALTAVRRGRVAWAIAALVLAVPLVTNVVTVTREREIDRRTLERSRAISTLLRRGDLLLYPGHTWDEYIGFYETVPVERFILASFAGEEQGDAGALFARMHRRIEATHGRGGRVFAVRVFEPSDSHHGWSLLRSMDILRDDVLAQLVRYEVDQVLEEPVGVWELRPPDVVAEASQQGRARHP
jgi:hypothetical protein